MRTITAVALSAAICAIISLPIVVASCNQQAPSLLQAAIACHQKGLALADRPGSCQERLLRLDALVQTDPDCQQIYRDAGTGLHCVDHLDGKEVSGD